jgi:cobalt-zinc-cadmium efflux system outer membrane protein
MKLVSTRDKTRAYFKNSPWLSCLVVGSSLFCTELPCVHAQEQGTASPKQTVERNVGLRAQSTLLLNLDDVINATLRHHPALKAEMQERVAADGALLSAEGAFDPSIKSDVFSTATGGYSGDYGSAYVEQPLQFYGSKVVAGYRLGRGVFPTYENYYETNSGGELGAGVEVPLLRDGPIDRRRAAIGQSISGQTIADSTIEQRKIELARAAALTYWDWTAARNKALVYKRLLQVADERDRQITERVKRGDLPDFDRIDNQRAVLQRKAQLLSAERAVKNAEFNLALFYRDDKGQPRTIESFEALSQIPLPLFVPDSSVEAPIAEAVSARPEFKNISAQREQNELELKLARNQILPRLDLRVFSANDVGSGEVRREEPELKAGVRIEIPLATRTQEGRIALFEARQQKLAFTETFLKERIRADVQDALNALDIARLRVDVVKREVEASEDLAKGELKRFELGDSNLIFVNLREQNAADAQVREIETLQDYQKAFVAFEATLARIASPGK